MQIQQTIMTSLKQADEEQLPKTYFQLMKKVGVDGPYQRNVFLIFCLNWFVTGLLIYQNAFLFMTYQFNCESHGLAVSDCKEYVCSLPDTEWAKYFEETDKETLSIKYGPFVCSDSFTVSLLKMVLFVGIFCGYLVILFFADNYGRKFSVTMAWSAVVVGEILVCVSFNLQMALVGLFLAGAGSQSAIRISMAVFGQIVDFYLRQKYSVALEIAFGFSGIAIGIVFYLIDDWRIINIFLIGIPVIIEYILFITYFQETPRFIIKKDINKAIKSLNRIGEINKKQKKIIDDEDINNVLMEQCDKNQLEKVVTIIDLFLFPSLRKNTIGVCLMFLLITWLYFGPVMIIEELGFNPYVDQIVISASELLAYPIAYLTIQKMTRRRSGMVCFGISVFFTGLLLFVEKPPGCENCLESIIELICVFGGRFVVSYYFAIFFLYATQLFPLRVRGQGFGVGSAIGAVASSTTSIIYGGMLEAHVNVMIFPTLCGVAAILVLFFLPETKDQPLPNEIEEVQFEKDRQKRKSILAKSLGEEEPEVQEQ